MILDKKGFKFKKENYQAWYNKIEKWKKKDCLNFKNSKTIIKPQYALQRLNELTKNFRHSLQLKLDNTKCGQLNI